MRISGGAHSGLPPEPTEYSGSSNSSSATPPVT